MRKVTTRLWGGTPCWPCCAGERCSLRQCAAANTAVHIGLQQQHYRHNSIAAAAPTRDGAAGTVKPQPRFWTAADNQRRFLEQIGTELGITDLSGWYGVSRSEVERRGGKGLFNHNPTLQAALKAAFPAYPWDSSKFKTAEHRRPPRWWQDISNQREFVEGVGAKLGVIELSDWYNVSRVAVENQGGSSLFTHYPSMLEVLQAVYPSYAWNPKQFLRKPVDGVRRPHGWWDNVNNQRRFITALGAKLGVNEVSDWRKFSRQYVNDAGGRPLWDYYASYEELLKAMYPDHDWPTPEHQPRPKNFWKDKRNLLQALDAAEKQIGITNPEDWYATSLADLKQVGFPSSVPKRRLAELLCEKYPDTKWDFVFLLRGKFAQQKRLERAVANLFPGVESARNVRKDVDMVNPNSGDYLELDVYLPSLNLAFEYQEIHHYHSVGYTYSPLEVFKQRDEMKMQLATEKGITLVVVPCWWDGKEESLIATIKAIRPDLLTHLRSTAEPIAQEMPESFAKKNAPQIEDIGQAVSATFFTNSFVDPTNWWLFEKYDGMRGFWNPLKKTMYSRNGKQILLPDEVLDTMPSDVFLDGELWFGRDNFQDAMKVSNRAAHESIDWSKFKFMVFDVPNHIGTYRERYAHLVNNLAKHTSKYIEIAQCEQCQGMPHLETFLQDLIDKGGEGIILRDPAALLTQGRSAGFLKHKKFRDAEGRVVGPAGPHQWECELPNGIRFIASPGTNEFEKRWKPQPGDIVSFKYRGILVSKKPKLATLYRLRPDMTWKDVVANWKEKKPSVTALPLRRPKAGRYVQKGYWRKLENQKKFLCDVAAKFGFDPHDANGWQNVKYHQLVELKGGGGLLQRYNGSLRKLLEANFPGIKYPERVREQGHWLDLQNRRNFLDSFAKHKGFDPLKPENWDFVTTAQVMEFKGSSLLSHFNGSLRAALKHTYPEFMIPRKEERPPPSTLMGQSASNKGNAIPAK